MDAEQIVHNDGCWELDGHHQCAISRIRRMRRDMSDIIFAQSKMRREIKRLETKRERIELK